MSEDFIALVPEDPTFVPIAARQQAAHERFCEIAPNAEEITLEVSDSIELFDAGEALERISCPSCQSEIDFEWWQNCLKQDYSDGFRLDDYSMPCCGKNYTLNDLVYEYPQGFGRFALKVKNPYMDEYYLADQYHREFEEILGTKLRVIYCHI